MARRGVRTAALGFLLLSACSVKAQPVRTVGLNRSTPRATYEYMVAMVGALQTEAEWAAFSPGFKRRLSESAGRNIDYGDYSHARATIAGNDKREMKLFLESEYVGESFVSDKEAVVTIRAGSRQLRPRMVKLSTWEVTLQGENQPVSGFIQRIADSVVITPSGDVQVRVTPESNTASFLKDIPADRIESISMKSEWFIEDFGGIEEAVESGLRGGGEAPPATYDPRAEPVRPDDGSPMYGPGSGPVYGPEPIPVAPHPGGPDGVPSPYPNDPPPSPSVPPGHGSPDG